MMSARTVVVTRPAGQAEPYARQVRGHGYDVLCEPVLSIETLPADLPSLQDYDALVFTSANGVRAFAEQCHDLRPGQKIYTVGDRTAQTAQDAGFADVISAGGDIHDLERTLDGLGTPHRILYPSAVDISRPLSAGRHDVVRVPVYAANAAQALTDICSQKLAEGDIAAVSFFSPRSARIFSGLVSQAERTEHLFSIKALCMSDLVVNSLNSTLWKSVHVARTPDFNGMTALLETIQG